MHLTLSHCSKTCFLPHKSSPSPKTTHSKFPVLDPCHQEPHSLQHHPQRPKPSCKPPPAHPSPGRSEKTTGALSAAFGDEDLQRSTGSKTPTEAKPSLLQIHYIQNL